MKLSRPAAKNPVRSLLKAVAECTHTNQTNFVFIFLVSAKTSMLNSTNSGVIAVGFGCVCVFAFCRFVLRLRLASSMSNWSTAQQLQQQQIIGRKQTTNKEKTFNVLTHNVWCHYFVPAPYRMHRLKQLVNYLENSDVDVVCLQELFMCRIGPFAMFDEIAFFCDAMKKLGYVFHTDPSLSIADSGGWLPFQNAGLIAFSRFPIQRHSFSRFQATSERLNNKGFECFEIVIGSSADQQQTVLCVNTHFDSRLRAQPQQMKQIAASAASSSSSMPFFAAGDWNIDSTSQTDQFRALQSGMNAVDVVASGALGATFRYAPSKRRLLLQQLFGIDAGWQLGSRAWRIGDRRDVKHYDECLDHVFIRNLRLVAPAALVDVNDSRLPVSDHFGVLVQLEIPTKSA